MATLKGQNFRILTQHGDAYQVVGMATNCVVTLGTNTEDASTKDDVGGASKPEVTSKNWQVSVESLSVTDAAAILTTVKSMTPFTLLWDETSPTDNQTALDAAYLRQGTAYLNDVTFDWNDRENSTKSLQFQGSSPLERLAVAPEVTPIAAGTFTKGQFVRLFIADDNSATPSKVVAAAKSLSLHVSVSLEDATTKDTEGDWTVQEPTGLSYDISTSALVHSGDVITSSVGGQDLAAIEAIYEGSAPVKWQIANVTGGNQRTKGTVIVSGSAILSQLTINAQNRQNATYECQLNGHGEYSVGA